MVIKTKKCLVTLDNETEKHCESEFLIPFWDKSGCLALYGMHSQRRHEAGMIVYTGQELSEKNLFARVVDSGFRIPDVDQTLKLFQHYLCLTRSLKIGDIVTLRDAEESNHFALTPRRSDNESEGSVRDAR